MSFFAQVSSFANNIASGVQTAVATLEEKAKQAASELEQQHRLTVAAKRNAGDRREDNEPLVAPLSLPSGLKLKLPAALSPSSDERNIAITSADLDKEGGASTGEGGESAVLPWEAVAAPDQDTETLRTQILVLSSDKRNFLVSPPEGTAFVFDMARFLPVALTLLKIDHQLEKMRFELVPKQINDETFWRNYFYRVSMLQQSFVLLNASLAPAASVDAGILSSTPSASTFPLSKTNLSSVPVTDATTTPNAVPIATIDSKSSAELNSGVNDDSLALDDDGLGDDEFASTESFGADWEKELQDELDEA